jgi:hypothetical protein
VVSSLMHSARLATIIDGPGLHPFTALKDLYLDKGLAPRVAPALQELDRERVTEVSPSLQSIFVEGLEQSGFVRKAIGQFVAMRELSGHSVAVHNWNRQS